jgi:ribosomal protein S18 acetylase RimI-like enzyme
VNRVGLGANPLNLTGDRFVEFDLRLYGPGDEIAVSLISQATILETYAGLAESADVYAYVSSELTVETFRDLLSSDRARIWALEAVIGKCVVGYALALSGEEGEPFSTTELKRLYLLYRFHGLGLGKRLMNEVLAHAHANRTRVITLRVHSQNERAIYFYERYGFKVVSEEAYRAGERDYLSFVMELAF